MRGVLWPSGLIASLVVSTLLVLVTSAGVYHRSQTLAETLSRLEQETEEMSITESWESADGTVTVTTTRGVPKPGQDVLPGESPAAWKARHRADVATARVEFPEAIPPTGI